MAWRIGPKSYPLKSGCFCILKILSKAALEPSLDFAALKFFYTKTIPPTIKASLIDLDQF